MRSRGTGFAGQIGEPDSIGQEGLLERKEGSQQHKMKIVCAWCNKKIGGKGTLLSHGICNKCLAQIKQPQLDFMETLPASPATRLRPRTANHQRAVKAVDGRLGP